MKEKNIERENGTKKENDIKKEIIDWIKVVVSAFIMAFIINNVVIVNAEVPTSSMESTIMTGDRIVAFRWSYFFEDPQRGDIVTFKFPDDEKRLFVKRIIGISGDVVEIDNGVLYLNGEAQQEDYLNEEMYKSFHWGPYEVPEDAYFMMGDNRNYSEDARFWNNTYVYRNKIVGKVIFKWFPQIKLLMDK